MAADSSRMSTPDSPPPEATPDVSPTAIAPESALGSRSSLGLKILISLLISAGFVFLMARGGLPLLPSVHDIFAVDPLRMAIAVLLILAMHTFRAIRLRHLFAPVGRIAPRRVLSASWIGFAAIMLFPLRAGEIVRPLLLKTKKIGLSVAIGTMGAERVVDGLIVTLILMGALLFVPHLEPLPDHIGNMHISVARIPQVAGVVLAVFVCANIAMILFYATPKFASRLVHATIGLVNQKLADWISHVIAGIASGFSFLQHARYAVPFLLESLVYWGCNVMFQWTIGVAVGLHMTFGQGCAVMGVLALGILIPAGPGLFGAFQTSTFAALAMFYAPDVATGPRGAVYVFWLYVINLIWHITAAGIGYAVDPTLRRPKPGAQSATE
jgi:hypothetical protein